MACCPEHGSEYFRAVLIARGQLQEDTEVKKDAAENTDPITEYDEDEDDLVFADDEDEEDDLDEDWYEDLF